MSPVRHSAQSWASGEGSMTASSAVVPPSTEAGAFESGSLGRMFKTLSGRHHPRGRFQVSACEGPCELCGTGNWQTAAGIH